MHRSAGLEHEITHNRAPIDAEPAKKTTKPNIVIDIEKGTYHVVKGGTGTHLNHFTTCPQQQEWRR